RRPWFGSNVVEPVLFASQADPCDAHQDRQVPQRSFCLTPGTFRGIGGVDLASLGIPSEQDYIHRYCERTGLATPEQLAPDWNFYLAYNMFRIAAILQGIAKRVEAGTASSAQARASGAGARPMAELAWSFAQKA
ncbi:MAG TPA: hypothetical protein PLB22_11665, partial [Ottowia sp.]|nr:hypothetical protein [Ottowia sp.]